MYPILLSIGPVTISSFGTMLVLAFFTGAFLIWKKAREEHFDEEEIFDATILTTFWGLIGARITYVIFHFNDFGFSLLKMTALTRYPGLSFLGALPLAIIALFFVTRSKKWDFFQVLDIFAIGTLFAQFIGLIGAFLNGTGYGVHTSLPIAITFPGVEGGRHPTQIYSAFLVLVLFTFLYQMPTKYRTYDWYKDEEPEAQSGLVFFTYLVFLGLITAFISLLSPSKIYIFHLSLQIWVGATMTLTGALGGYIRSGRKIKKDSKSLMTRLKKLQSSINLPFSKTTTVKPRKKRRRSFSAGSDVK